MPLIEINSAWKQWQVMMAFGFLMPAITLPARAPLMCTLLVDMTSAVGLKLPITTMSWCSVVIC